MHTSYETILLQRFQDMGHYYNLESYNDPISNKYKKWMVSSQDIPYYMHTSYETILLQRFQEMRHYSI